MPLLLSEILTAFIDYILDTIANCMISAVRDNEEGCLAVEAERGKTLAALVTYLGRKTLDKGIQILTVSSMDMYGEYKPYNLVENESVFIQKVLSM